MIQYFYRWYSIKVIIKYWLYFLGSIIVPYLFTRFLFLLSNWKKYKKQQNLLKILLNIVLRKYQPLLNICFSLRWYEEAWYFKGEVKRLQSCYFLEIFTEHKPWAKHCSNITKTMLSWNLHTAGHMKIT